MQRKIILILVFALLIAVFAIQNANTVSIRLFNWAFSINIVYIVLGSVAFGAVVMALVSSFNQLKMSRKIRKLEKEKEELQNEIKEKDMAIIAINGMKGKENTITQDEEDDNQNEQKSIAGEPVEDTFKNIDNKKEI
ncbi:MAG: lipopolysaccharide assembly protein LapA domain-containing protein [Halanaerobiales bacterium]